MSPDELDYLGIERWAPFTPVPGVTVSTHGRIRGVSGKELKQTPHEETGYMRLRLWDSSTKSRKWFRVHRIVATAFIPNPYELPEVHHKDHDITHNRLSNLEWVDRQTNMDYRYADDRDACGHSPSHYVN